uniref:Ig-like domain-containing protein n=1 Tax=Esox lucius TaxID=8010 RepID=A0A3P8YZP5_ESOLU
MCYILDPHFDPHFKFRSKVPGVMITQYVEEIPEGKSHPDFTRKPIALTIQEGKFGVFKAIVIGEPTPKVTWNRANGNINDPERYQFKFDEVSGEHTLEIPKVCPEDADTYKCFATNEIGKAVCPIQLNVIEVGFKKTKEIAKSKEELKANKRVSYRKLLKKCGQKREEKPLEPDEKIWEILMSADKKDYERICAEYGITNFRGMLTRLAEMKKEREEEQAQFIEHISSLKHIEVAADESATFEIDMDLKDPSSRIFLYKDGVMVPYTKEAELEIKHGLKQVGKKYIFSIKNLDPADAGLYSVDVEGVNVFSTDFKIPTVNFAVKIQEVKAEERQDALFQCVLTAPMNHIHWIGKNIPIKNDDKFEITVSEDKLIHKLLVKDCQPLDAGIYAAVAGLSSCNAWLVVEADQNPANKGKKIPQKFVVKMPEPKTCNLERPPKFLVPLKMHNAPQGYECYMTCAVRGEPTPHVTWYRDNISLNTNTNYLISNTCGVCSMLILTVGTKDTGEYTVVAENALGRAECSTKLIVKGMHFVFFIILINCTSKIINNLLKGFEKQ